MSLFRRAVLLAALLAAALAVPAAAHLGNPDYRSVVREIVPPAEGLSAQVIDHDDALLVINHSSDDVVIYDAQARPYARLLADGTVQVNASSAAAQEEGDDAEEAPTEMGAVGDGALLAHAGHEHDDAPARPRRAGGRARAAGPRWVTLDRTGRFQWHEDRIKYRASPVPPQVTDRTQRAKVMDWRVPIAVGGEDGAILGTLWWVGEPGAGSSFPTAAVVSLVVLVLLAVGAVVLVRRRRAGSAG